MPGNTTVTGKAQAMDPTSGHVTTYSEVRCRAVGVVRVRVALFGVSKYMCSWYQNVTLLFQDVVYVQVLKLKGIKIFMPFTRLLAGMEVCELC